MVGKYSQASLQELLDHAYYAHNRVGAISEQNLDPLLVVYENSHRANLPAIALVCALFAYGGVGAIVGFLRRLDFSLLGDLVLGEQCGSVANFAKGTDRKSANLPQSLQSSHSPTAIPRILREKNQTESKTLESKNLDSSASHNDSSTATILNNSAQDSRICDEKSLLCEPRKEIRLGCLSTQRGKAIKDLSRKAESSRLANILRATFPYYRFQTSDDVKLLFASLACIIAQGGLESSFCRATSPLAIISAISQAICTHASKILEAPLYAPFFSLDYRARFLASGQFSQGFRFLVGISPSSPLKRWNMFLRWLVRKDHIDLGLWQGLVSPSDLLLPLDTHTLRISRALTLLERKSYDRKAVLEVSANLKRFCAHDPIRYDFALYRLGQSGALES